MSSPFNDLALFQYTGSAVTTLEPVASPEPTPVVDTSKIKLSKKTMNLMAGKKITLKVTGTTSTVTWTSSDESIATVSDKGVVKGIKKGSTEVQASVDGIKLTCKVSVVAKMSKKDFDRFGITETRYVRGKRKVPEFVNHNNYAEKKYCYKHCPFARNPTEYLQPTSPLYFKVYVFLTRYIPEDT